MTQQEHKHYCLLKYVALLDKQKRDDFFYVVRQKHGAKKLEQLKSEARKVYLELKINNLCAVVLFLRYL